jgi:hypothetical protein
MDKSVGSSSNKEIFDMISFHCLSALENHEEIEVVDFQVNEAVKPHLFQLWQSKNSPYILPDDLKQFYSHFDGISIEWKVNLGGNKFVTVGHLSLNKLEDFKRIPVEGFFTTHKWLQQDITIDDPKNYAAFIIDSNCKLGDIILLFSKGMDGQDVNSSSSLLKKGASHPSVWLVDLSQEWHFISLRFDDYLNLMFAHYGIIGWQEAFTTSGLSTTTGIWMNLFCKERLCVDKFHQMVK